VEDDEAVRRLLARRIERAGYRVFEASDGLQGFTVAQRERLDVVVSDLEMPHLDGWGLLRVLRDDPASHALPVVLLSAHDDSIDTLKAARAGARAYLKKNGHARELLAALSLLTEARQRVWAALEVRADTSVELPAVGAAWLLETVAELDLSGRLELEDHLGRYEVTLAAGHLVSASAQVGSLRVEGAMALEAVVTSRARGRFFFLELVAGAAAPWLFDVLAQVNQQLSLAAARRTAEVASAPRRLRINDELASLYGRVASPRELRVIDGLRLGPASLEELATLAATPPHDVSRLVSELVRRGVVTEDR
jgi:DNA-binding response OmpR family regulator